MTRGDGVARSSIHFGGPDRAPRALRDLLATRIEAVPPGGAIDWITYYFRDEGLAEALLRAQRRGVVVTVSVDADPRHAGANDRVLKMLSGEEGLGKRLHAARYWLPGHLHTKLYCFSHPRPAALVGSFNPSGNQPEHDPDVIADIGDQDRGHNLLVEIDEPRLVRAFRAYAGRIHRGANRFGSLVLSAHVAEAEQHHAFFFPRLGSNPLDGRLAALGPNSRLRIAASHLGDRRTAEQLVALVRRGGQVDVLTHHTQRRSPSELVQYLRRQGVRTYRYEHPEELPMHAKFIVAEDGPNRWSAFGSYNLNRTSRWANEELLVFSENPATWQSLSDRWETIVSEPWCKA